MPGINTNIISLTTQQGLKKSQSMLATSMERLSSGLRVNSAKDDAAGQAIGNRMSAQHTGLSQAARNANDGISLSQTAQGTLDSINDKLHRIRELTVQALNDTYKGETGDRIQAEINLNLKEIERLNETAEFNGIPLLSGEGGLKSLQVGANDAETIDVDLGKTGFSVDEIGLKDLNIQGEPGNITHIDQLQGGSNTIPIKVTENIINSDSMYKPPGSSPKLVKFDKHYNAVQLEGDGGRMKTVDINAHHDTDTRQNKVGISVNDAVVETVSGEYMVDAELANKEGDPLGGSSRLVRLLGSNKHWIESQESGGKVYYEAQITTLDKRGATSVFAQALSGSGLNKDELPEPKEVSDRRYSYGVKISDADYSISLDGKDEVGNDSINLVKLGGWAPSNSYGNYYVEEEKADGSYSYYKAEVKAVSGGGVDKISVVSNSNDVLKVEEEHYVDGSTEAHFKPSNKNVTVNYTDRYGNEHEDVMVGDEEDGYRFNIGAFSGSSDSLRTANIVENDDGEKLLRTVNGSGEVVLYYDFEYSVSTNVEENETTVRIREFGEPSRIRTPPKPLAAIDAAMERVDERRSEFGALDNRLESVIEGNTATGINLQSAESRIVDADYAKEVATMTKSQIIQQAGNSMLAQANVQPEYILALLE